MSKEPDSKKLENDQQFMLLSHKSYVYGIKAGEYVKAYEDKVKEINEWKAKIDTSDTTVQDKVNVYMAELAKLAKVRDIALRLNESVYKQLQELAKTNGYSLKTNWLTCQTSQHF